MRARRTLAAALALMGVAWVAVPFLPLPAGLRTGTLDVLWAAGAFGVAAAAGFAVFAPRNRAARTLRRELEREHDIRDAALNATRTGVCLVAEDGSLTFRNEAWRSLLWFVDEEPGIAALVAGLAPDGSPGLREGPALRFWTPHGRYLSIASSSLPGSGTLLTVDDLTDQEQERATRNRFLAEVVGAQDHEARRVAELLHDDVVQRLTALGLRLELTAGRSGEEALLGLAREAGAITAAIRRLLVELHPAVLESQGLAAAVDAAAGSLRAHGVEVGVEPLRTRVPQELEQLSYRLVQEAFANVLRHASATHVDVRFELSDHSLTVEVADDGDGFDVEESATALRRGSLGLQLVRERVALARGRFELVSGAGTGTSFRFELPLGDEAASVERLDRTAGAAA